MPQGIAQLGYEQLDEAWKRRSGESIAASFGNAGDEGWDAEAFRAAMTDNLLAGKFRLIIAVDKMTDELQRTVTYINEHSRGDFKLFGLELHYIDDSGVQILTPILFGKESADAAEKTERTRSHSEWNEERFFEELSRAEGPSVIEVAKQILDWAPAHGISVHWGMGAHIGGMNLRLPGAGYAFLQVQTDGKCVLSLGMPHGFPKPSKHEVRAEFRRRIGSIPGLNLPPNLVRPNFPLAGLNDSRNLALFREALEWAVTETTRLSSSGSNGPELAEAVH